MSPELQITLNHSFLLKCFDLNELLTGCNKISTFCSRLEKQSTLFPDRYDPNLYRGGGLELFTEALIKLSPTDNRIGIGQYKIITGQDVGVDGSGIGVNGKPATVQVKYRGNSKSLLTANNDHLSNFVTASIIHEKVDVDDYSNMLIITTAKGLHFFTDEEMYGHKVRCLGRNQLRELVDNNLLFWDNFRKLCGV